MFSKIIDFVKALYVICRLDAGPQKLPSSTALLTGSLIAYILGRMWVESLDHSIAAAGFLGVFDALLLVLVAGVPLTLLKFGNRILQTLTAMACAGVVVCIAQLFLSFLLGDLPLPEERFTRVVTFLTLPLLLWKVLINTVLLKSALSWGFLPALGLSLGHLLIVFLVGGPLASGLMG
ncbi:conserved hypothetical protein [Nitrosococcus halophilus Nc 4]|uniref:Yip1 domain-containing protein n=1 Tax=Nitrosococcus halophilus (strain Nc4) TaxID=472759 RepID=D5BZV7_NITHN|nr:hypothetical protein [Nitrosococcus halophilus]ADE16204.1 conserved hypothetical protein [Nitrosococcus halophilus Nc 4]